MNYETENMNVKKEIRIYARISTRERALNGYGIEMQIRKCKEYTELFDMCENANVNVYRDDGYSAKDMNRPAMNALLSDIKDGKLNTIVIYKLDRLTRSVPDVYEFVKMLMEYKCNLIAVVDKIDIYSANGRLLVGVLAIIAQWERETIIERTNDALIQMCEEGKFPIGHTPFGYYKKDNRLYVKDAEKIYVDQIFASTISGKLPVEVYRELKEMGLISSHKSGADFVKNILVSHLYYGEFKYKNKIYSNIVPSIITKEVYTEAKAMRNKRYKENNNVKYYFGYKVRCRCGEICACKSTKKRQGGNIKRYYYYACLKCLKRMNQDELLQNVLYRINIQEASSNLKATEERKRKSLKNLDKKANHLYEKYVNNDTSVNEYMFSLGRLQNDREKLMQQLNASKLESVANWDSLDDQQRKSYIHKYLDHLIVDLDLKLIVKLICY